MTALPVPGTDKPREEALSRAVSAVDLTATLAEVQNLERHPASGLRYSQDLLLSLRERETMHAETIKDNNVGQADGQTTPQPGSTPQPPPPTPDNPEDGIGGSEEVGVAATTARRQDTAKPNLETKVPMNEQPPLQPKAAKAPKAPKTKKPPPSGFEEFYADPPITPDEYDEEADVYDVARPFHERMQTCIQRYKARRKLDEVRNKVISKYFTLGGVETTGKMFTGGLDKETLETSSAAEIAAVRATDFIRAAPNAGAKYYDGSDGWVVDFEGVAKGFFSYRVPRMFSTESENEIKTYSAIIRNFLNYILHHGVCKEYTEDVMAARRICDRAEYELWTIRRLQLEIPGDYNVACSVLFGGRYRGMQEGMATWLTPDEIASGSVDKGQGFSIPDADRIVRTCIELSGDEGTFRKLKTLKKEAVEDAVQTISSRLRYFEVVGVERATQQTIDMYARATNLKGEAGKIQPLGHLKVKQWEGPGLEDEDYTDDEGDLEDDRAVDSIIETFWFEDALLPLFLPGLKFEATVCEISLGIRYMDTISGLYCSFWTYLPNEKMISWKDPVPNTRPPPTVDDPEVEERALEAAMDEDMNSLEKDFKSG